MNKLFRVITVIILVSFAGTGITLVSEFLDAQVIAYAQQKPGAGWTINYCQQCEPSPRVVTEARNLGTTLNPRGRPGKITLTKPGERTIDGLNSVTSKVNEWKRQQEGQQPGTGQPDQQQPGQEEPDLPEEVGEVCVVVAAGWAAKNEKNEIVDDKEPGPSIPEGHNEYGTCLDEDQTGDPYLFPDCPYRQQKYFRHKRGGSVNYDLFHNVDVSLGENVRKAKKQHGTGEKVEYWIPNKEQAENFVKNEFKYYDIDGQQVSEGPKQTDKRSIDDPVTGDKYAVKKGCKFVEAQPEPEVPDGLAVPPGLGEGTGGGGSGEDSGILDWLLPLLMALLAGLAGGEGGGEPEREPTPSPAPDFEDGEPSPLTDEETLEIIDTELERLSDLGLSEEILDKITQSVMDIIFRIFYGEFALDEIFAP